MSGQFWDLAILHIGVATALGLVYRICARGTPREEQVGALWYLGAILVMPVTYLILTPLALFTLDTGSWETRGGVPAAGNDVPRDVQVADAIHLLDPKLVPLGSKTLAHSEATPA